MSLCCCHQTSVIAVLVAVATSLPLSIAAMPCSRYPTTLGFYPLQCDADGNIVSPWPSLRSALDAEMAWYCVQSPVVATGRSCPKRVVAGSALSNAVKCCRVRRTAATSRLRDGLRLPVMAMYPCRYAASPPAAHGYPTWMYSTFVDGEYNIEMPQGLQVGGVSLEVPHGPHSPSDASHSSRRRFPFPPLMAGCGCGGAMQVIGAMQDGMAVISYLKYYELTGRASARTLQLATQVGYYLCEQTLTEGGGAYGNVTRSSGWSNQFPQQNASQHDQVAPGCGRLGVRVTVRGVCVSVLIVCVNYGRGDLRDFGVNTIEPDKLGITGYALHVLYDTLNGSEPLFLAQALHQVIKLGDDKLMKLLNAVSECGVLS